jgi:hypothetical protein
MGVWFWRSRVGVLRLYILGHDTGSVAQERSSTAFLCSSMHRHRRGILFAAAEDRCTEVAQLECRVHGEVLRPLVGVVCRIVANEDVVGLDIQMDDVLPSSIRAFISPVGEPSFHHQTGFDERFEDVPDCWFWNVAFIIAVPIIQSHVVVHQPCCVSQRAVFDEQLRDVSLRPPKRTCFDRERRLTRYISLVGNISHVLI